jgi:hypothetical protein
MSRVRAWEWVTCSPSVKSPSMRCVLMRTHICRYVSSSYIFVLVKPETSAPSADCIQLTRSQPAGELRLNAAHQRVSCGWAECSQHSALNAVSIQLRVSWMQSAFRMQLTSGWAAGELHAVSIQLWMQSAFSCPHSPAGCGWAECSSPAASDEPSSFGREGTQFTCSTSTNVLLCLLALLVQRYKYWRLRSCVPLEVDICTWIYIYIYVYIYIYTYIHIYIYIYIHIYIYIYVCIYILYIIYIIYVYNIIYIYLWTSPARCRSMALCAHA